MGNRKLPKLPPTSRLHRGHTLCQAPELPPWPEEVRVWLPLPQLHPVAVAIEILVPRREGRGNRH